jgi:cyclophilin family peptidyl-prolyl cis-trans isomerase
VLRALERAQAPDLPEILAVYLTSREGPVLRAALEIYKPGPSRTKPWTPIIHAYAAMATADDPETKVSILNHLEPWMAEPEVQATVRRALDDRVRNVRVEAIRLLRLAGAQAIPESAGESETRLETNGYEMIAAARQDRTVAILETGRGRIEIDLFRQDAPVTVSNFVQLAKSGYFEGQSFMRVVPFFVVQTGDPRNDQEGGPGYTIRCEINERPFERGSVGMALAGKDTGGSQFFITLAPQPHLDGGYTCFGRVIAGMQVVDRLTPDDRIRSVTIEEDRAALNFRLF